MRRSTPDNPTRRHIQEEVAELIGSGKLPITFNVDMVADKIGRSRSLVYSIFGKGREGLLRGVLETGWAMVEDRLSVVSRGQKMSALEQLHAMVEVIFNAAFFDGRDRDRIVAWFLCRRGGGLDLSEAVIEEYKTLNRQVDALLRAAASQSGRKRKLDPGTVAAVRGILLAAVDGSIWDILLARRFRSYRPGFKADDVLKQIHALINAFVDVLKKA